jgi:hypothetical protein
MIHRVGYCLRIAALSGRTMVINNDARDWKYTEEGWVSVYKPVSNCSFIDADSVDHKL